MDEDYISSNLIVPPKREVEEWVISPASEAGACRFESGLPDNAGIAQWLVHLPARQGMPVRFWLPAQGNIQQIFKD